MYYWYTVCDQSKSTITSKTEVICNQANCDLLSEIHVVSQSLLTLCKDCGSYNNMSENDTVKQLCIHCVMSANAILNYQHENGNL